MASWHLQHCAGMMGAGSPTPRAPPDALSVMTFVRCGSAAVGARTARTVSGGGGVIPARPKGKSQQGSGCCSGADRQCCLDKTAISYPKASRTASRWEDWQGCRDMGLV